MNIFNNIDLNLLRVFEVIYSERHISRAADSLGMTQSAVSHALKRLRQSVDDPLFIRSKNGVEPTARADELALPLRNALEQISSTLSRPSEFIPATSDITFRFGLPDHAAAKYAPRFLKHFRQHAPNLKLSLINGTLSTLTNLVENGQLDMAANVCPALPPRFKSCRLFTSRYRVIAAKDHPLIKGSLNLDDYVSAKHVVFSVDGGTNTAADRYLAEIGLERQTTLSMSSHLATPIIVANSDMIATVTRELVDPYIERYGLQVFEPPIPIPDLDVSLFWHQRNDRNPANQWLRQLAQELTKDEV
jgi:DNA-binding transcriptional LysR family regulator